MTCEKCGQTHDPRKCPGHVDEDDGALRPCGNFPIKGGPVCWKHGGTAKQVRNKANLRLAEQKVDRKVERWMAKQEVSPITDPLELLAQMAARADMWMKKVEELVADLDPQRWRYGGGEGGEQLRAEVALFERAMDRVHRQLVDIAKLNIEERLAKVKEIQLHLLSQAMTMLIDSQALGLDRDHREVARREGGRILRQLNNSTVDV